MNSPQDNPKPRAGGGLPRGHLTLVGAASAVALLLFVVAQWPQRTSDAARVTEAATGRESQAPMSPFAYFPAQYRNSAQSAAPEEHIQAF